MVIVAIDQLAVGLPLVYSALQFPDAHWNWSGKLLSLMALSMLTGILLRSGFFKASDFGLSLRQRAQVYPLARHVVVPALVVWALLQWIWFAESRISSVETHLYELTLPGLAEELAYRGLLLGIWLRLFEASNASRVGYPAIVSSLMFALTHGLHITTMDGHMEPAITWAPMALPLASGILFALCRQRTGSIIVPIIFHNLFNEISVLSDALK